MTLEKCWVTLDMMGLAEKVMEESLVGRNGMIELLEIAGGLCTPWLNDDEWLSVRSKLKNWKAKKGEASKYEDMLESVMKGMEEMTVRVTER